MYTVCPKCALTLVVTATDLRVAQGFVRCGRCSNVFNALARLSEDRSAPGAATPAPEPASQPAAAAPQGQRSAGATVADTAASTPAGGIEAEIDQPLELPPPPPTTAQTPAAAHPSPPRTPAPTRSPAPPQSPEPAIELIPSGPQDEEAALEFNPDAADVTKLFVEQAPDPQWSAATGKFRSLSRQTPNPAAPVSRGSPPPAQQSTPTQKPPPPQPTQKAAEPADSEFEVEIDADLLSATARFRADELTPPERTQSRRRVGFAEGGSATEPTPAAEATEPPESIIATETETAPRFSLLWGVGTGALVLALFAQIVHHYRQDLAATTSLYKPLTGLYSAFGVKLVPRWNLGAYDVRQLGASADSTTSGRLTVRASVKNTAKQAQPLPLLRVMLQDRFGNRIAARDVPPEAYLPRAIAPSSFLSSGQRIDAEMAFVDPGTNAVGFEIDACLPAPGGSIECANDSAR